MHNCSMLSKAGIIFLFSVLAACSPLKEKATPAPVVEMDVVDPDLALQFSNGSDHDVIGNLSLEVQQEMASGKTSVYAMASFHEPVAKNVLFDKIGTSALSKNNYKPKPPGTEPCGIPGFPDCATGPNPPPPVSNPDEPCGIPGFPDCATGPSPPPPVTNPEDPCGIPGFPDCPKQLTFLNQINSQEEK